MARFEGGSPGRPCFCSVSCARRCASSSSWNLARNGRDHLKVHQVRTSCELGTETPRTFNTPTSAYALPWVLLVILASAVALLKVQDVLAQLGQIISRPSTS